MKRPDDKMRSDFETTFIFHADLAQGHPGFLVRADDGTYRNERAEVAFQGYKLARNADAGQLCRFAPDRVLVPGMLRQLNETLESAKQAPVTEKQVRVILKVIGGLPATQST